MLNTVIIKVNTNLIERRHMNKKKIHCFRRPVVRSPEMANLFLYLTSRLHPLEMTTSLARFFARLVGYSRLGALLCNETCNPGDNRD